MNLNESSIHHPWSMVHGPWTKAHGSWHHESMTKCHQDQSQSRPLTSQSTTAAACNYTSGQMPSPTTHGLQQLHSSQSRQATAECRRLSIWSLRLSSSLYSLLTAVSCPQIVITYNNYSALCECSADCTLQSAVSLGHRALPQPALGSGQWAVGSACQAYCIA